MANDIEISANDKKNIQVLIARTMYQHLSESLMSRGEVQGRLGQSWYSPNTGIARRNIYEALGYVKTPVFADYMMRFDRQDIAARIVSAPVFASWRLRPDIMEVSDTKSEDATEFEKAWRDMEKDLKVIHYLNRADLLSGIGRYGILLLGFDDGKDLSQEVNKASKLLYLMPYTEDNASIQAWNVDPKNERCGLPEMYQVRMANYKKSGGISTVNVHHSRIIHVAEGCLEDDVFGTPRLKGVYNRLQDLELVAGSSAEMFWRGAMPGLAFKLDPEADITPQAISDVNSQVERYMHGLVRYLRLQGMDIQELAPAVADPTQHVDIQIQLISAATGIPKRILTGSERGELASSQDETNWTTRVSERRENYVEPMILRPFIDVLIKVGVLPDIKEYLVEWPSLFAPSEADRATTSKTRAETLSIYSNAQGADEIIPPNIFLRKFLEFDEEEIEEINLELEGYLEENEEEEEEEDLLPIPIGTPQIPIIPTEEEE